MNCMILVKLHVSRCQFCNQSIKDIFNVYDLISIIPLLDKYLRQKKLWKIYIDLPWKTQQSHQLILRLEVYKNRFLGPLCMAV